MSDHNRAAIVNGGQRRNQRPLVLPLIPRYNSAVPLAEKVVKWMQGSDAIDPDPLQPDSPPSLTALSSSGAITAFKDQSALSCKPVPGNMYKARPPMMKTDPEWKSRVEVKVCVTQLPQDITTYDLYNVFSRFGNITKIDINENRNLWKESASVFFCPPPTEDFWLRRSLPLGRKAGERYASLRADLEPPHRSGLHPSPVDTKVWYRERIVLPTTSLSFGFMYLENTMMEMYKLKPHRETPASFVLNLLRREIELRFSIISPQESTSKPATKDDFLIRVPFTKLGRVYEGINEDSNTMMVIPLDTPPEAFKRTRAIGATHVDGDLHWTDRHTWLRQTSIGAPSDTSRDQPVCLVDSKAIVHIGQWTTIRLEVSAGHASQRDIEQIRKAMSDYNILFIHSDEVAISTVPRQSLEVLKVAADRVGCGQEDTVAESIEELADHSPLLAFPVQYQLEVCISRSILHSHNISTAFLQRLAGLGIPEATALLEHVVNLKNRVFDPMQIFTLQRPQQSAARPIPAACTLTRAVTITPTTMVLSSPVTEISNRVLRKFKHLQERFLRVKFSEEGPSGRLYSVDDDTADEVFARVSRAMKHGIVIGNRKYEFLAFGNSQFREHGACFFAPSLDITTDYVRGWLGDFENMSGPRTVARWCARLGQNFSTTRAIEPGRIIVKDVLKDVKRNGFNFTDGVGKISHLLATMIGTEFGIVNAFHEPPSVVQFRMGGCKGVLTLAPELKGREIHIRESQYKFAARLNGLEVIQVSQFSAATTNRQLITLLSALGVPDEIFLAKLRSQLEKLDRAMTHPKIAIDILTKNVDPNQSTLALASIIQDGFMQSKEPYAMSLLLLWRTWSIKYLKDKAKLFIEKGACVLGCVDEYAVLQGHIDDCEALPSTDLGRKRKQENLPEIFLQIDGGNSGKYKVIEGICVLCRNPSLHPGDIRVVKAVDKFELHHIKNAVVLPQNGDRDLASMCSGGDLDGDDYLVIWDQDLLPPAKNWNLTPMDFSPAKGQDEKRQVTADDLADFFVSYIKNDRLPTIAHAHLALSDWLSDGAFGQKCLELAHLHSLAVDYPKSGVPVRMPRSLKPWMFPHFMEKKLPAARIYRSTKILGQLYDKVKKTDFRPHREASFNENIFDAYNIDSKMLSKARELKDQYDAAIRRIMAQHGIATEFEVVSGFVLHHNFQKKDYDFGQELGRVMTSIRQKFRQLCVESAGGETLAVLRPFAAAMYSVTVQEVRAAREECLQPEGLTNIPTGPRADQTSSRHVPLISFPWIFARELGTISNRGTTVGHQVMRAQGDRKKMTTINKRVESAPLEIATAAGNVREEEDLIFFDDVVLPTSQDQSKLLDMIMQDETSPDSTAGNDRTNQVQLLHKLEQSQIDATLIEQLPVTNRIPAISSEVGDEEDLVLEYVTISDSESTAPDTSFDKSTVMTSAVYTSSKDITDGNEKEVIEISDDDDSSDGNDNMSEQQRLRFKDRMRFVDD